jgi:hypothetical protein
MTDKTLKTFYPRLRPDERFRLAVEAAAREDWREVGLLSGSCPTHMYYATDFAYRSRLLAAEYIALSVTNLLFHAELDLARPAFARDLLDDMHARMTELDGAGAENTTIEAEDWPETEIAPEDGRHELEDLYCERVAAVLGICEGFERFCNTLRVEPAKLLAIQPNSLSVWHSAGRLHDKNIASNPEMAEGVYKYLQGIWSRMLRTGASEPEGAGPELIDGRI